MYIHDNSDDDNIGEEKEVGKFTRHKEMPILTETVRFILFKRSSFKRKEQLI